MNKIPGAKFGMIADLAKSIWRRPWWFPATKLWTACTSARYVQDGLQKNVLLIHGRNGHVCARMRRRHGLRIEQCQDPILQRPNIPREQGATTVRKSATKLTRQQTAVGKVDEILGPINQVYFTIKPQEGIQATSFKKGDKFYIGGDKLLPLEK